MKDKFLDAAGLILGFKTHRDTLVRKMVITLIPTLAVYDPQTFSEHHVHQAMAHLLTQLDKPNERSVGMSLSSAVVSVGPICEQHSLLSDMWRVQWAER